MSQEIVATLGDIVMVWINAFLANLPAFLGGLLVVVVSIYAGRLAARLVAKGMQKRGQDPEITLLLGHLARWIVITLGVIIALQLAGQDVGALVAGLGVLGFTIGFALQDISANFVSGVLLLVQQPFDIGDAIEVAGFAGTVTNLDLRTTQMITFDGRQVLIPNSSVLNSPITHYGRTQNLRTELVVGVGYDSDLDRVRQVALDVLKDISGLTAEKLPTLFFENFGGSSIDARIYMWFNINETTALQVKDRAIVVIKTAFEAAGIDIPFPIQTVHLNQ